MCIYVRLTKSTTTRCGQKLKQTTMRCGFSCILCSRETWEFGTRRFTPRHGRSATKI